MSELGALPDDAVRELEATPPRGTRTHSRAWAWPTIALVLALVATVGFLAGVEVQKRQEPPSSGGTAVATFGGAGRGAGQGGGRSTRGAGGGGGAQGRGAAQGGGTVGEVKVIDGSTLYLVDQDGNTVRVVTTPSSRVAKSAEGSLQDVRPGDTLVVQGTKAADGSVEAGTITVR